mgnify:CR=1 FL=1
MSDKITDNGHDDSIDKENHNPDLTNSEDAVFKDEFSNIEDDMSFDDFEGNIEDDFSGLDDVETGNFISDYYDEDADGGSSRVIIGDDNTTSIENHEFENDEFGDDDFSDISEFDSTPGSTAILHEDTEEAGEYPVENSSDWDEDEFSDPINNEEVAITSNSGTVFDDEETPYYNDDYRGDDIEVDDLDNLNEDSGLPWWAWLIIAGILSGLIAGGAYLYNKDRSEGASGSDSGNVTSTTGPNGENGVPNDPNNQDSNVSNSELNALRKELEDKQAELDRLNEEKAQLQAVADDAQNNSKTVTETKEVPGPKTILTTTQRLPAETFTNTETRTLTNTITNTITREAPAPAPQKITVTSTAQAPRSTNGNNNAPRTVTQTTTVTRNNQGQNATVTRTVNNVVTRTNTVYRTTTITYERYIQQRYS